MDLNMDHSIAGRIRRVVYDLREAKSGCRRGKHPSNQYLEGGLMHEVVPRIDCCSKYNVAIMADAENERKVTQKRKMNPLENRRPSLRVRPSSNLNSARGAGVGNRRRTAGTFRIVKLSAFTRP